MSTTRSWRGHVLTWAPVALAFIWFVTTAYTTWLYRSWYLWDFKIYYFVGKAYLSGADPFQPVEIPAPIRGFLEHTNGFSYAPHTLPLLGLLARLDFDTAAAVWVFFKVLIFAALIFVWARYFLREHWSPWFPLFCLLAYTSSFKIDLRTGQVTAFEMLPLWLGFLCFLRGKLKLFCALVLVASFWKFTPLFFLSLLFFSDSPRRHRCLAGALGALAVAGAIEWLVAPGFMASFYRNNSTQRLAIENGYMSPTTHFLLSEGFSQLRAAWGLPIPQAAARVLTWLASGFVLLVSFRSASRFRRAGTTEARLAIVCVLCLAYALALPRFMDYQYVLLLVPTWFVGSRSRWTPVALLLFASLLPPTRVEDTAPGLYELFRYLWTFYDVFLAYIAWGLLLRMERPAIPPSSGAPEPARA